MSLLLAHRGGEEFGYGDNTERTILESIKRGFDIIELDIRKSKDGELYCYHGSVFEVCLYKFLLKRKNIADIIQEKNILTLHQALNLIGDTAYIFLDIKEYDITSNDIELVLKQSSPKKLYISGFFSLKKLLTYRSVQPFCSKLFLVYVHLNPVSRKWIHVFDTGIDIVQLFFWQLPLENTFYANRISLTPLLTPKRIYKDCLKKFDFHYISTDFTK